MREVKIRWTLRYAGEARGHPDYLRWPPEKEVGLLARAGRETPVGARDPRLPDRSRPVIVACQFGPGIVDEVVERTRTG